MTIVLSAAMLAACGPQIGDLEQGESGRVVRAFSGDTLVLDTGLRVFLAEVDAPQGDQPFAAQANGELEAMALHRNVQLAYGGARRWTGRPRADGAAPAEAAIAHVFVQSEGGRWFWLQHALAARGAVFVRPRRDNNARAPQLLEAEAQARAAERGLWAQRAYRPMSADAAIRAARAFAQSCTRGDAPYRLIEARVSEVYAGENRAALDFDAREEGGFSAVLFGESFTAWQGAPLSAYANARVRVRGPLGVYRERAQLCLDHESQIEKIGE